ncbi:MULTISPECIES: hypothetical protein [unclassified Frigoribacterium]|jgi:hypothetical protein|uniref:hypothetical protein n=1 Tax=unclassified Frigoribacterium TaxID=2627005 RepID=UPI0006F97777|nr:MULTISPECIES: hypothetical protein [unclassified Frigoribacterium]KQO46351.1 hypothetical protein ASF07_00860 [Frigoribacterium sp. Leaf254]KQT38444.1 hypothetical protein ASG28_00860 [Frigoribacterium sp. Leaf415]
MISLTGVIHPTDEVAVLHVVEQKLRRHFPALSAASEVLVLQAWGLPVRVTEQLARLRLDVVVGDQDEAATFRDTVGAELRGWSGSGSLRVDWTEDVLPAVAPATLGETA